MRSVAISDLKPGMTLARTIVNDDLVVILAENTVLTEVNIRRLSTLDVPFIYIKDEFELNSNYLSVSALFNPGDAFINEYKEDLMTTQKLFEDMVRGEEPPVYETKKFVHESLLPLSRNSGVVDYLFDLNHLAADMYNHSLRVAILSGVIAKWMEYTPTMTQEVILAGFLHDIGKTKLPENLQHARINRLSPKDRDTFLTHTSEGAAILRSAKDLPDGVLQAVMQHHEFMDGSGGPLGLSGNDIHKFARIIAVADYYDNVTTEVEGEKKESPLTAVEQITKLMYKKFDPNVCIPFLNKIKLAFLGSRVLLSNGMVGVVLCYANSIDVQPLICINGETVIDLNEYKNLSIIEYNPK